MKHLKLLLCYLVLSQFSLHADETLPPLKDNQAPKTFEELWAGYDPAREPLETEVLKQWEETAWCCESSATASEFSMGIKR